MSEKHIAEHDQAATDERAVGLLDRAADLSPLMTIDPDAVLTAGRRKVRRRRASALGAGTAALALAGGLWVAGPFAPLSDTSSIAPAAVNWEGGHEAAFLDNQPHSAEAGRAHWEGTLVSAEGEDLPHLVLTRDGEQLDPIAPEEGPGDVLVYRSSELAVAVWASPSGSLGEQVLWNPGLEYGQAGDFAVDGVELWYASAEFRPGTAPGVEELYWFGADAAHAASGATVDSTLLTVDGTRAVVMIDEARGVWATDARPTDRATGQIHVATLSQGAGYTGWLPAPLMPAAGSPAPALADVVPTSVGVLPPGATLSPEESTSAKLAQGTVGDHPVVLVSDPEVTGGTPPITYRLDGQEHNLQSWVETDSGTIDLDAEPDL